MFCELRWTNGNYAIIFSRDRYTVVEWNTVWRTMRITYFLLMSPIHGKWHLLIMLDWYVSNHTHCKMHVYKPLTMLQQFRWITRRPYATKGERQRPQCTMHVTNGQRRWSREGNNIHRSDIQIIYEWWPSWGDRDNRQAQRTCAMTAPTTVYITRWWAIRRLNKDHRAWTRRAGTLQSFTCAITTVYITQCSEGKAIEQRTPCTDHKGREHFVRDVPECQMQKMKNAKRNTHEKGVMTNFPYIGRKFSPLIWADKIHYSCMADRDKDPEYRWHDMTHM